MRVLIDALGAPRASGGMRLYVDGVLRGWLEKYPEDRIVVIGGKWVAEEFGDVPNLRVRIWPNENAPFRVVGQLVVSAVVFVQTRSEVLISLSPIVSPLVSNRKRTSTVQDWRHIKNPHEFNRGQLLYRKLWRVSVATAGSVVAMSQKTQDETLAIVPSARTAVVETGRDYVRYWPTEGEPTPTSARVNVLTFGHHANKRPELALDAFAKLNPDRRAQLRLVVLGARGAHREELRARARTLAIDDRCEFPGFVEEGEYRALVRGAALIILASSDEGFGLPIAEANYLGIPALVTSDSGMEMIHPEGVVVAEPNPQGMADGIEMALVGGVLLTRSDSMTTWAQTASGIRSIARAALSRDVHHAN
jgi:glycosyltransferase involved in cell wall biosynthesis